MNEEEYLKKRLDKEIKWHTDKCNSNKKWFNGLRLIELISAALVPFLAGLAPHLPHHLIIMGALGVVIAVAAGMISLNKYHENWIEFRQTAETLKHEKYLFQTNCKPYHNKDAFSLLVLRVESVISKENTHWSRYSHNDDNS